MEAKIGIGKPLKYFRLKPCQWFRKLSSAFSLIVLLWLLPIKSLVGQDIFIGGGTNPAFIYDEVPIQLIIEGYGSFNLDVIFTNEEIIYLNVEDLFKTIGVPCNFEGKGDSITGFIENEANPYLIDFNLKLIHIRGQSFYYPEGLIKEMGSVYLESSIFSETFGINLTFNYRSLTIILKSDFELPVIKQLRLEKIRNNLAKVKGETIADTVLKRDYHLFEFGMVDWAISSSQIKNQSNHNHFRLGVGAELLYGETDVFIDLYNDRKFDDRQLHYIWRWVDNDKTLIRQAQAGKISTQSIAFINSPLIGAVVRNTPTTVRKASGFYTINEYTEPNWTVELYINNVMVDYTRADASGLYTFKVPNVYGFTTLKFKFYGPMGEERTEERTVNIPYNFMPAGEYEYGLSAGIVKDSSLSRFGKSEINYGVNRILTVGGGVEYLSSIPNAPLIPFLKTSIQPFSKLTLNAEFDFGVGAKAVINYNFFKRALLVMDFSSFKEGQLATHYKYLNQKKLMLSLPYRLNSFSGFAKLDYTQSTYKTFNYNIANSMFSAYYKKVNVNLSVQLNWIKPLPAYATSVLSLSYRLKTGYIINSSAQYNISESSLMSYRLSLEKRIKKGYISTTYERNVLYNDNFLNLTFRYDLSFARTNFSVSNRRRYFSATESAQGSFAFGSGNKYVHISRDASVGKGGISIYPFLDINNNGIFDEGEKMVKLNSVKIFGGKVIFSDKDSIIRMPDLIPFTYYNVEFDNFDLENIAWRFNKKIYSVLIDPNQFKRIDIPVASVGEASGTTYMKSGNYIKGTGRILVNYYRQDNDSLVAETMSESDGYSNYLGLYPGEYLAKVDSVQLERLDCTSEPEEIPFTINPMEDGDIVFGLDFVLIPRRIPEVPDTSYYIKGNIFDGKTNQPVLAKIELIDILGSQVVNSIISGTDGSFAIKVDSPGKFGVEVIAKDYLFFLETIEFSKSDSSRIFEKNFYLEKIEKGTKLVLENIYFETNKAILYPASLPMLNRVVDFLKNNEAVRIEISGHTDNVGSATLNNNLSQARAKAVIDYFAANGIGQNRLVAKGYGFTQPIESNKTPEGKARNRRVELKIL